MKKLLRIACLVAAALMVETALAQPYVPGPHNYVATPRVYVPGPGYYGLRPHYYGPRRHYYGPRAQYYGPRRHYYRRSPGCWRQTRRGGYWVC